MTTLKLNVFAVLFLTLASLGLASQARADVSEASEQVIETVSEVSERVNDIIDIVVDNSEFAKLAQQSPGFSKVKLSNSNIHNTLTGFIESSPFLSKVFKHKKALGWFGAALGVVNLSAEVHQAANRGGDIGGIGGVIAETLRQVISFAASTYAALYSGAIGAGIGSALGPLGTLLGGGVGGVAGASAATLIVNIAFLGDSRDDQDELNYLGLQFTGHGRRDFIARAINQSIRGSQEDAGNIKDQTASAFKSNQSLITELHQRFTNAGFTASEVVEEIGFGGLGLIRGQLIWSNTSDLDLVLILPAGGLPVSRLNPSIVFNGGGALAELDQNNLGNTIDAGDDQRIENIVVTGSDIQAGSYIFLIQNTDANGNANTAWNLTLTSDAGQTITEESGSFIPESVSSPFIRVESEGGSF